MADDQDASNEVGDEVEDGEIFEYDDAASKTTLSSTPSSTIANIGSNDDRNPNPAVNQYDDGDEEPIEDYVVKLVVNEAPEEGDVVSDISKDIADAAITDIYGNTISTQSTQIIDAVNTYSTAIYEEIASNTTAITDGGKRWWGWSIGRLVLFGLIALCILGAILACLFFILGKKFRKNKRTTASGTTTTVQAGVNRGVTTPQRYDKVPPSV